MSINAIGISGSIRHDSYNRKALQVAKSIVNELGGIVSEFDLKTWSLPLYDADIESEGFPDNVVKIRSVFKASDLILVATPEYNHSISGVLKNAIDWLSTGGDNVLNGKTAVIFGASTGFYGTLRAQLHLRQILAALNVTVLPQPQVFIRNAHDAFNDNGSLKDVKVYNQLKELIQKTMMLLKNK